VPLRDVQEAASHADPRTTMRYDRARAAAWTGTQPTSSPPTSRAPPGNPRGPGTLPPGGLHSRRTAAHGHNQLRTAASIMSANRRSVIEQSLRSGPLKVRRTESSVARGRLRGPLIPLLGLVPGHSRRAAPLG
jgi:hypothetical protein